MLLVLSGHDATMTLLAASATLRAAGLWLGSSRVHTPEQKETELHEKDHWIFANARLS